MRIRKHAKNSAAAYTASCLPPGTVLQTYVCQLNQSPWDVMNFSPPSPPPPPPPPSSSPPQVNGVDVSGGNGSSYRRNSLAESEMKNDVCKEEYMGDDSTTTNKAKEELPMSSENRRIIQCCKTDGRSWRCRREAAEGSSLCYHHLSLAKNHHQNSSALTKKSEKPSTPHVEVEPRRSTRSSNKVESSSSDSNEFYYYSGFCPGWCKKTRSNASNCSNNNPAAFARNVDHDIRDQKGCASLSSSSEDKLDCEDDDDEDVDSDGYKVVYEENRDDNGKKRARKPIKARSLKSLM